MTRYIQYIFCKYAQLCTESQFTKMSMLTLLQNAFSVEKMFKFNMILKHFFKKSYTLKRVMLYLSKYINYLIRFKILQKI